MNKHKQDTIDEIKKVGIIGGGRGGTALLQTLSRLPQVVIVGICDIDSHAPALDLAKASGIETYTEMEQLVDDQPVDWLINATNRSIAQRHIISHHYDNVTLIDGHIAELIWQLLIDFEKVLARDYDQQGNDIKEATFNALKWALTQRIVDNAQPVHRTNSNILLFTIRSRAYIAARCCSNSPNVRSVWPIATNALCQWSSST